MARGGVTGGSIRIEGLSKLVRDFNRLDKRLAADMRKEFIEVGQIVVDEARDTQLPAQQLAAGQGGEDRLANTGALQNSIRARMRGTSTIVESRRTKTRPFAYGSIYEFQRGRPFLVPALEAKTEEIIEALDQMLDRMVSENGFGKGGLL